MSLNETSRAQDKGERDKLLGRQKGREADKHGSQTATVGFSLTDILSPKMLLVWMVILPDGICKKLQASSPVLDATLKLDQPFKLTIDVDVGAALLDDEVSGVKYPSDFSRKTFITIRNITLPKNEVLALSLALSNFDIFVTSSEILKISTDSNPVASVVTGVTADNDCAVV